MRKLLLTAALVLVAASHAAAQDYKVEVFTGYSYARLETPSPDRSHLHGWNAAIEAKLNPVLGLVADFSGHYGNRLVAPGIEQNINTYSALFGPRLQVPGRVRPFAHALFGVARGSAGVFGSTSGDTAFGMAAGGGIDADLTDSGRVSWRIIQADYLMNRFFNRNNNNFRLSSGLVFRF
jgi:opacity protein-like surface antigen